VFSVGQTSVCLFFFSVASGAPASVFSVLSLALFFRCQPLAVTCELPNPFSVLTT